MGKRAKSARALKRKLAKRALKEKRKALYLSYAGTGRAKKSKRFKLGNRRAKNAVKVHMLLAVPVFIEGVLVLALRSVHASPERCGNHACRKSSCH